MRAASVASEATDPLAAAARVIAEDQLSVIHLLDGGARLAVGVPVAGVSRPTVAVALAWPLRALEGRVVVVGVRLGVNVHGRIPGG